MLQPGCEIQVAMVSKQRLQQLALATNELRALDRINSVNSAAITEQQFHQLVALTRPQHQDPIQAELIEAELLELMSSRSMKQLSGGELSHRAGLMKDLIAWGRAISSAKVISLEDLTSTIFASRSAIVHSCRSTFGLGPMAPLEADPPRPGAGTADQSPEACAMGFSTVQAVATHFGFSSRNHFARDYRQLFGEAPSATLQRCTAPVSAPSRCRSPTDPR